MVQKILEQQNGEEAYFFGDLVGAAAVRDRKCLFENSIHMKDDLDTIRGLYTIGEPVVLPCYNLEKGITATIKKMVAVRANQFPFKETIYFTVIVMMLMPYQVTLVSNFIVVKALHMDNTYWSIFLPGIFSPFGVFLMRQGFDSMPQELREAAMLEGCQELRILTKIALPVCRGQLTALVLLCFVDSWNMVEQPLVFLKETFRYPISVFLAQMDESRMDILCTCGILVTLPTLLLFLFCEEDLMDGIAKWKG